MNHQSDSRVWQRIARLLSREISDEEARRLRYELEEDPETHRILVEAEKVWEMVGRDREPDQTYDTAWRELRARVRARADLEQEPATDRIAAQEAPSGPEPVSRATRRGIDVPFLIRTAAVLALALTGYLLLGTDLFRSSSEEPAVRTYTTKQAQLLTIRLADGSTAQIGPETELRVPKTYPDEGRKVELRGLGYFEVESSPANPFLVQTAEGTVGAIGTQFSVRAYPEDGSERLLVKEGVVRLQVHEAAGATPTLIQAGHAAEFSADRVLAVAPADISLGLAWRYGRLGFTDAPLKQVLRDLERWYGLEFRLGVASLGQLRFTGDFSRESVKQIADILSATLGITYEVRGGTVVFVPSTQENLPSTDSRSSARSKR